MDDIQCFAYAEDALTCQSLRSLVAYQNLNSESGVLIRLREGFPANLQGSGTLKKRIPAILKMAEKGIPTLVLTDLDTFPCPSSLITDWFRKSPKEICAHPNMFFRVAVREIEAWIMADRHALADFLAIPSANFVRDPDRLVDPKTFLINVVRKKGRKAIHRHMLPAGNARIGVEYNTVLSRFISERWSPERAAGNSPSLQRALSALSKFH